MGNWSERVLDLVERFGPFTLAWLKALLRAADQRASKEKVADTWAISGGSALY